MASVRLLTPSDFEQVYPLLHWIDPVLEKSIWRRIFDYNWRYDKPRITPSGQSNDHSSGEPCCGYGLFDEGEAVGFLGFIFSDRTIASQNVQFCNLTTWVVKPEYRSHSLSLMMPVMRLKDYTITDLSASSEVADLSKRLGFEVLDDSIQVLLPIQRRLNSEPESQILVGDAIAEFPLNSDDLKVFNDHCPYPNCYQLVLQSPEGYCHVIYTLNRAQQLSYAHIQSISDRDVFARHHRAIRRHIMNTSKLPLTLAEPRLLSPTKLPFSYRLPLSSPRIYRSAQQQPHLQPHQVDNLYSELVLLGFNTSHSLALGKREKVIRLLSPAIMSGNQLWKHKKMGT